MGQVLHFFQLCSDVRQEAHGKHAARLYRLPHCPRPRASRSHKHQDFIPLFDKAVHNAKAYMKKSDNNKRAAKSVKAKESSIRRVYFHLTYHEDDPNSREIPRIWSNCMAEPPEDVPLNLMVNLIGQNCKGELLEGNYLEYQQYDHLKRIEVVVFDQRRSQKMTKISTTHRWLALDELY